MKQRLRRLTAPSLLLIALLIAACGASARTLALRTSLVSLNVARDTLLSISKTREDQIVAQSATKDEGKARFAAWRPVIDKIAAAIDDGYRLIYGAALLDDAKSASDAATAVAKVLELIKELKALKDPLTTTAAPPATATTTAKTPTTTAPAAKEKQ
jgi:hypothetical protein